MSLPKHRSPLSSPLAFRLCPRSIACACVFVRCAIFAALCSATFFSSHGSDVHDPSPRALPHRPAPSHLLLQPVIFLPGLILLVPCNATSFPLVTAIVSGPCASGRGLNPGRRCVASSAVPLFRRTVLSLLPLCPPPDGGGQHASVSRPCGYRQRLSVI